MDFQTLYTFTSHQYEGELNDGTLHVVPNDALSPKQILERFVHDMPVPATSTPIEVANDNLDNEAFPMQGQEFDPLEERDKLMRSKNTELAQ